MFPFCGVTCTDCQTELKCFLRYISLEDYEKFRGRNHVLYFSASPWLTWPRSCTHQICLRIVSINNWHVHRQWNRLTDCGIDIWSHMSIKGGNSDTSYSRSKPWRHCVSWDKPDIKGQILKTYPGNMNFPRTNIGNLYNFPPMVKFMKTESRMMVAWSWGEEELGRRI